MMIAFVTVEEANPPMNPVRPIPAYYTFAFSNKGEDGNGDSGWHP